MVGYWVRVGLHLLVDVDVRGPVRPLDGGAFAVAARRARGDERGQATGTAPRAMPPRPARPRKARRVTAVLAHGPFDGELEGVSSVVAERQTSMSPSSSGGVGIAGDVLGRSGDDERVARLPGQSDLFAVGQGLGRAGGFQVLGIGGHPVAVAGLNKVLGADADVAGVEHDSLHDVGRLVGRLAIRQPGAHGASRAELRAGPCEATRRPPARARGSACHRSGGWRPSRRRDLKPRLRAWFDTPRKPATNAVSGRS